jgi:hypothetical protein
MNFPRDLGIARAAEAELKVAAFRDRLRRRREALENSGGAERGRTAGAAPTLKSRLRAGGGRI